MVSFPAHEMYTGEYIEKYDEKQLVKQIEKYNKIDWQRKGLVYHLKDFDVNSKDERAIAKTKIYGEILNMISDENDKNTMLE